MRPSGKMRDDFKMTGTTRPENAYTVRMKSSDISDRDVLELLAKSQGTWSSHCWGELERYLAPFPPKLGLSKMRQLHKRGLVGGCICGCRGDWEITDKGLALIGQERTRPYNGY